MPQDGRHVGQRTTARKIDLRVATLPTVWGEKVVMRILDNTTALLGLSDLGFSDGNYERFAEALHQALRDDPGHRPDRLRQVDDAVRDAEHRQPSPRSTSSPSRTRSSTGIPGINQVQVNAKAGLTFAAALRSILRSDPDVVLIGEIRDHETAQIAIEAALTGHLVLSTLHTNDAPSAVTRLIEMGIEPFLVGSALDCVVAQRLCRAAVREVQGGVHADRSRSCVDVGFPWQPGEPLPTLYRPVGCAACSSTGYRGGSRCTRSCRQRGDRAADRRALLDRRRSPARPRGQGMVPLREDGWLKVAQGDTSIEEVLRVVV